MIVPRILKLSIFVSAAITQVLLSACNRMSEQTMVGHTPHAAIIGGKVVTAEDSESKSTVLVLIFDPTISKMRNCTGTLIQQNLLVSAAHCFLEIDGTKLSEKIRIFLFFGSTYDGGASDDLIEISWKDVVTHPQYSPETPGQGSGNDISVIRINGKIPGHYKPVRLAVTEAKSNYEGANVILAGFGQFTSDNRLENSEPFKLRKMTSIIVKNDDHRLVGQIAVKTFRNLSPFYGDSGGPAYFKLENELLLVGICSSGSPGLVEYYESIQQHTNWLKSSANQLQVIPRF